MILSYFPLHYMNISSTWMVISSLVYHPNFNCVFQRTALFFTQFKDTTDSIAKLLSSCQLVLSPQFSVKDNIIDSFIDPSYSNCNTTYYMSSLFIFESENFYCTCAGALLYFWTVLNLCCTYNLSSVICLV